MPSAKKKLEVGFKEAEQDIIISSVLGVIISTIFTFIFCYISFFAVNVALLKRKIEPMPFDEFIPFFIIGFIALMIGCKHYQPEEYESPQSKRALHHAILGFAMMIPNLVNQNIQGVGDLFRLKSSRYSLDLALEILKMSKKGTLVKEIYSKNQYPYQEDQIRLTISLLEKAEFIFINKVKWECFTTESGDEVLFEWRQEND